MVSSVNSTACSCSLPLPLPAAPGRTNPFSSHFLPPPHPTFSGHLLLTYQQTPRAYNTFLLLSRLTIFASLYLLSDSPCPTFTHSNLLFFIYLSLPSHLVFPFSHETNACLFCSLSFQLQSHLRLIQLFHSFTKINDACSCSKKNAKRTLLTF